MTRQVSSTAEDSARDREPLLEVRGLKKHFVQSDGFLDRLIGETQTVQAVNGIDLTVHEGETLGIVGESGCGKSTVARTIMGIYPVDAGHIYHRGTDLTELSSREMQDHRQDIQMIFQDPLSSLNPRQRIREILTAPMKVHGIGKDQSERVRRAKEELTRVGLKEEHLQRYPHQFSGGQQQRIAIARALTLEPELLIADEPVSALDVSVQAQILELLNDLKRELGLSIVFIAHDLSVVRYIADRMAVMYLGEIVEAAQAENLFTNPQHPYTKSLILAVPRISRRNESDASRVILQGTVPSPINPPDGCRFHTRCPEVIPPSSWSGSQEEFKAAFTFRNTVLREETDPEAIRARLEGQREEVTAEDVQDQLINESLPGALSALPASARDAVRRCAEMIVADDWSEAKKTVVNAFPSVCERQVPDDIETEADHVVSCHRFDDTIDPDAVDS